MEVTVTELRARLSQLLDRVAELGEEVVITRRGRAIARLVPLDEGPTGSSFGALRGTARILGDIVDPTGEIWEAASLTEQLAITAPRQLRGLVLELAGARGVSSFDPATSAAPGRRPP